MARNVNNRACPSFFNPAFYGSVVKIVFALILQIPAESIF